MTYLGITYNVLTRVPSLSSAICACSFNKREEDFSSKTEYDDYLEEREDISEAQQQLAGPANLFQTALRVTCS